MRVGRVPLLLLALFALALARVSGFFTDDSYIHLVFARNLARGLGFCFNPGVPSYGFTSPLWVLCLATGQSVARDWLLTLRLLGLVFTLLAVASTYRLARAARASHAGGLAAAAALALHAWFLRWSLSGMETSLAAFLVAVGLGGVLRGRRAAAAGMFALALAALARPEALLVFGLAAAWSLARPGRGGAALGTLLGAGALGAWEYLIHARTGSWIPATFAAKRAHEALDFMGIFRPTYHFLGVVVLTDAALIAATLVALWRLHRRRELDSRLRLLLLWPALLAALYLGTRFQMISRYWVPALPALCALAAVSVERAFAPAAWRRWCALYLAQQAAVFVLLVSPGMAAFTRGLEAGPARIGRWLHDNTPDTTVVATPDIGAIGFYSERRVLDLGGLVTPEMQPVLARHDLAEIVRDSLYEAAGRPDYLVDRDPLPGALISRRHHLVMATRVENLGLSRPRPVFYSLYRIRRAPAGRP